jgi:uncharacterized protein YrrD
MLRGHEVLESSVSVCTHHPPEAIARAIDLNIDPDADRILTVTVDRAGKRWQIPFRSIQKIGNRHIKIDSESDLKSERSRYTLAYRTEIHNKPVISPGRRPIGTIQNCLFNEKTGKIRGYEIQGDRFDPLVISPDRIAIETDRTWVVTEAGLKPQRHQSNPSPMTHPIVDPQSPAEAAIGKRVRRSVTTETGTLLVVVGQEITVDTIMTARRWGMLNELYDAIDDRGDGSNSNSPSPSDRGR